jgi:hypothetical protein
MGLPNGDGNGTNGVLPTLPEGTGSTTAQNN